VSIHFKYPDGATPLDPNELNGLIPSYITTQGELDAAEQAGILDATAWALDKRHKEILTDTFIRNLHKRMFKLVWKWAGQYRTTDKSIGIHWSMIATEIKKLCQDTSYWVENKTYSWDELGARFHHRLVSVHPFPNGNGRHTRLMTDILLLDHGQDRFTWGANADLGKAGAARKRYIDALKSADGKKFGPLIKFVRS
jgi:Fic-DOC domain mobile mystery protein B